jgi:hypothetical protein
MNQYGMLTVVMPLRPGSKQAPYVVNVKASQTNGLDQDHFIEVARILSVDHSRILGLVDVLEEHYWKAIRSALELILSFDCGLKFRRLPAMMFPPGNRVLDFPLCSIPGAHYNEFQTSVATQARSTSATVHA